MVYRNAISKLNADLTAYGRKPDDSMIPRLKVTYRDTVQTAALGSRVAVYDYLVGQVQEGSMSANVLIPFIGEEPDHNLASRAAIDFVMLHPETAEVAMSGAAIACLFVESGELANPGAVFGGLLSVGDPRVCMLLRTARPALTRSDLDQVAHVRTGFVSVAAIEFLMDWIEECIAEGNDDAVGPLAACMVNHVSAANSDEIIWGMRPIPHWVDPDSLEEPLQLLPLGAYLASIRDRLLAIEATEREPKVLPFLRMELGL